MSLITAVGDTLSGVFSTVDASGSAKNADATPTLSLYKNDVLDGATVVTLTNPATGKYHWTFAVPGGYSNGDRVRLEVVATVDAVVLGSRQLLNIRLDTKSATNNTLLNTIITNLSGVALNVNSLADKIGAFTGTATESVKGWLTALFRTDATLPAGIGGTYAATTDSLQAIRDRGDAAWVTGGGGGGGGGTTMVNDFEIAEGTNFTKDIADSAIVFGVDGERRTLTVYKGTVCLAPTLAAVTSKENLRHFQKGAYVIGIHSSAYAFVLDDDTVFSISDNFAV